MEEKRVGNLSLIGIGIALVLFSLVCVVYVKTKMLIFIPIGVALIPVLGFAFLSYCHTSLTQIQLKEKRRLEDEKGISLHDADIFDGLEDAMRVINRTMEQFVRYIVPVVTFLLGGALLGFAYYWLRHLYNFTSEDIKPIVLNLSRMGTLAILGGIITLIAAGYFVGVSREKGARWLRAVGAWLFFFCFILGGGVVTLFTYSEERVWLTLLLVRVVWCGIGVLGLEMLIGVIIEFYRPRIPGEEERPVYESRLLSFVVEPGGVAKNIAASLDYQFGFKVSDAWFYSLLERAILPIFIFSALMLWGLTSIVQINVGEEGLKETFGTLQKEVLHPGLYFKLPLPFERIIKYPTRRLDKVYVGTSQDVKDSRLVQWAEAHGDVQEQYFVTAGNIDSLKLTKQDGKKWSISAYLVAANIPVYFRVKNLYDFYARHSNPRNLIATLAHRVVSSKMGEMDFNTLLTVDRLMASAIVVKNLQELVDQFNLGVEISFIGFNEIHPPVEVGKDFNAVVSAGVMYDNTILQAEIYAAKQIPRAEAEAVELVNTAKIYRDTNFQEEETKKIQFESVLRGYQSASQYFLYDQYLSYFERELKSVRSYLLTVPKNNKTFIFDQTDKITSGLTDVDFGEMNYGEPSKK